MKTILLTGGLGFIGSHICVELLKQSYNVVIFDNLSNSKVNVIDAIHSITGRYPQFVFGDVCNSFQLNQLFQDYNIDIVIHLAGLKSVGESIENPIRYYSENINGLIQLLSTMKKYKCNHLIFSSSATVYGKNCPKSSGCVETIKCCIDELTNPYAKTKYILEEIIRDFQFSNKNFKAVILRYFNPIGCHPSGLIGENPTDRPNNLFPYIIKVVRGEYDKLRIFGTDYDTNDGTCERDFIHVCDLADSHIAVFECFNKNESIFVYNVGTGVPVSVSTLINTFKKINQVDFVCENTERRPGDIDICYSNVDKIKNEIGWVAKRTIEDCCRDGYSFIQKYNM